MPCFWNFMEPSSAAARKFISGFWSIRFSSKACEKVDIIIVPDGHFDFIMHEGIVGIENGGENFDASSAEKFMIGQTDRPFNVRIKNGSFRAAGVKFRPEALKLASGGNLSELINKFSVCGELFKTASEMISTKKGFSLKDENLPSLMESIFKKNIALFERCENNEKTGELLEHISRSHGLLKIGDIARENGFNMRKVERVFIENTGMRPKTFSKILRLNYFLGLLCESNNSRIDEVCDYYCDRSHFHKELRGFSGIGSGKLLNSRYIFNPKFLILYE